MIASLMLKGKYDVGVNKSGDANINNVRLNVKDIPFVRFNMGGFGADDVVFFKKTMERFKVSTPLIQLPYDENVRENLKNIEEGIGTENVPVFIYLKVVDRDVERGMVETEVKGDLKSICSEFCIDQICLVDNTDNLYTPSAEAIIKDMKKYLGKDMKFSICNSPLSYGGYACLTAIRARELMAEYSEVDDVPLPSANHEKGCCGCIQYFVIDHDYVAPADKVSKKTGGGVKKSEVISKLEEAFGGREGLLMLIGMDGEEKYTDMAKVAYNVEESGVTEEMIQKMRDLKVPEKKESEPKPKKKKGFTIMKLK